MSYVGTRALCFVGSDSNLRNTNQESLAEGAAVTLVSNLTNANLDD